MKIWTNDRSNNVHTQRTPLQHRATLHRTTRTTLTSLLFGRYACLLCFPLFSRKGLLATSWRCSFGLLLSRCGASGSGCMTPGPIGAFIFCDRFTRWKALAEIYTMLSFAPFLESTIENWGTKHRSLILKFFVKPC